MRNSGKTTASWALKLACLGALGSAFALAGCSKMESAGRQGDRVVDEQLAKSETDRDAGGEKARSAAFEDVKKAAAETTASAAGKVRAKSELAREEFARATAQLPDINHRTLLIEQALWDFRQAAEKIQATQRASAICAKMEPKETLAKTEEDRVEIKKNTEKAKAGMLAAQGELDKRQKEIDGLKEDRKKAESEADALTEKSSAARGEESVKLFAQASELRTKAGTLAAQIEIKTAALLPFQKSVEIAQKQQQVWDNGAKEAPGALQQLDEHKAQIDSGWTDTQAQAQGLNDSAKKIVSQVIAPNTDAAHPNAGALLVSLVAENDKQRAEVSRLLTDSIKHSGEAASAARQLHDQVQSDISKAKDPISPPFVPLKNLIALYDENQYLLQQGNAQNALADLYAGQVLELQHRKQSMDDLAKVLQGSGLQAPAQLPTADAAKATDDATKAYKDAEATLDKVSNATSLTPDLQVNKNAGLVGLLHALLGRYELTHDAKAKEDFNLGRARAKEASLELPSTLKQALE